MTPRESFVECDGRREEHIRAALHADRRAEAAFRNGDGDYGDWLEELWIRCAAAGIDPMDLHHLDGVR